jgi:hypothetical protein
LRVYGSVFVGGGVGCTLVWPGSASDGEGVAFDPEDGEDVPGVSGVTVSATVCTVIGSSLSLR